MKTLDKTAFDEIRAWMHRNARPVDMALWRHIFEDGDRADFLRELRYYQNADGGFGHALEADHTNPNSTPASTQKALELMDKAGVDPADAGDITEGIVSYLSGDDIYGELGWRFRVPSNNDYPHAIWWTYEPTEELAENIGLTAIFVLFAHKYAPEGSKTLERARRELPRLMSELDGGGIGEMGAKSYLLLLMGAPEIVKGHEQKILETVDARITRDTSKWSEYCRMPSDLIMSKDNPLYERNKALVEAELDYIIDTRPKGGVWDITWQWYDDGKYADAFSLSRNWYRAEVAIDKLLFLRAFGRLQTL